MLIDFGGFNGIDTSTMLEAFTSINGGSILATSGRNSNAALSLGNQNWVRKAYSANFATAIIGICAEFATGLSNGSGNALGDAMMKIYDGTDLQLWIGVDSAGAIKFYRNGSTLILATSPGLLHAGAKDYFEFKIVFNGSTGSITIRKNGIVVTSATGLNTSTSGNAYANIIEWWGLVQGPTLYSDYYLCDATGSSPTNDFLGDCRCDPLVPNGDGNYTQFTPSTGSTHYTLVDDAAPNNSDYNDGATVGDRDSYTMTNLPALTSQTVYGVKVKAALAKDDAGSKSAAVFVRSSTTNSDGASFGLSTTQQIISTIFEQNPATSTAWTETTVNAMEAGVKVTA